MKILIILFLCLYHITAFADKGLNVPNGQYVLIERQSKENSVVNYAGFKLLQHGIHIQDPIEYEWISMNKGETLINIESQNFKFGQTTTIGKYGIGFEGYRFTWEPTDIVGVSKISKAFWSEDIVKVCLSEYQNLWGIDIQEEMSKLKQSNKCFYWR